MSNELFLIAHKVRNTPAFDVAEKMICVHCQSYESITGVWCEATIAQTECHNCDGEGYIWIIPTSGHRAYPYYDRPLNIIMLKPELILEAMPPSLPDHYPTTASPTRPALASLIPPVKIQRRF